MWFSKLNDLLNGYLTMYHSFLGLHWRVTGDLFFDLHGVYGGHYAAMQEMADQLAERIVGLGGVPECDPGMIGDSSVVDHIGYYGDPKSCNKEIEFQLGVLHRLACECTVTAMDSGDCATSFILMGHCDKLAKMEWMYRSFNKTGG